MAHKRFTDIDNDILWRGLPYDLTNAQKRRLRLKAARKRGTHTNQEWEELKEEFCYRCVQCGIKTERLEKDHIVPLSLGGGDTISNIQPLCSKCNMSKAVNNYNWKIYRKKYGWLG